MRLSTFFLFLSLGFFLSASSQIDTSSQWAFMNSNTGVFALSNYGTMGIATNTNKPSCRQAAANWKDNNGDLWLFGGDGIGRSTTIIENTGLLNDLWKYNRVTNQWVWINGDTITNRPSNYGTMGIATAINKPSSRASSITWKDNNGNFWLYGGDGYYRTNNGLIYRGYLSDLWKYNSLTNQWTWIKGDTISNQSAVYGTMGIEASTNNPGNRRESANWVDSNGNFWFLGGYSGTGIKNDLWKYNISTNNWTWVKGDMITSPQGVYGTINISAPNNKPGGRYNSASWSDAQGNFWLFGGYGRGSGNFQGTLNDLWKYNPTNNEWTWVKGRNIIEQWGNNGIKGVEDTANLPESRFAPAFWKDNNENFWIFGGYGNSEGYSRRKNDLWKYTSITNNWTLIKGDTASSQKAVYATYATQNLANKPGCKGESSFWYDDISKSLWVYGGFGKMFNDSISYTGDLWKLSAFQNIVPIKWLSFTATLKNNHNLLNWKTLEDGSTDSYEVEYSNTNLQSSFTVIGKIKPQNGNYQFPHFPSSTVENNFYKIRQLDKNGSSTYSHTVLIKSKSNNILQLFPNPATDYVNLFTQEKNITIAIIDYQGKTLLVQKLINSTEKINLQKLARGTYSILASQNDVIIGTFKIVKE